MTQARLSLLYTAVIYFVLGYIDSRAAGGEWAHMFIALAIIIVWRLLKAFIFKPRVKGTGL